MTEATQDPQDPNAIIRRRDIMNRYEVCSDTVRKWMKTGKLPPYDEKISHKTSGWLRSTLVAAGVKV